MSLLGKILNRAPVPYVGRGRLTLPWLGSPNTRESQIAVLGSVGTLFAIVHRLANSTSQVSWRLWRKAKSGRKEDRIEVTRHLALQVWNTPNPFYTHQELVETAQQHDDLTGEGWLCLVTNPAMPGVPTEIWPVRPDRMEVDRTRRSS